MNNNKIKEAVITLPVISLKPFENYPFLIRENENMAELVSSIKESGITTPLTVIPSDDGSFEIISGHRRKRAAELAGLTEVPAIIKHYDREEAIVVMVDSNIHRDYLLPSEKAKAYAMKNEALKRKRGRPTLDEAENKEKGRARELTAKGTGMSCSTVERYIGLNRLIPEIMTMVDSGKLGITSGFELSHLTPEEQQTAFRSIETEGSPSLSQAQKIRQLSKDGKLNDDTVFEIMCHPKKSESFNVIIPMEKLKKYFPRAASPKEIEEKLLALCERLYQQQMAKKRGNER